MFDNLKKKSLIKLILLVALLLFLVGCQGIRESNADRSGIERLDPIIGLPPDLDIPQNSITEYYIARDTYIKELKLALAGEGEEIDCGDEWVVKGEPYPMEGSNGQLCVKYNGDGSEAGDLTNVAQNSITEREIAANTYIKDLALINSDAGDCEEDWSERTFFRVVKKGWLGSPQVTYNYKVCAKYNEDGSGVGGPTGIQQNSITEFHIKKDLLLEDVALTEDECGDYGDEWEVYSGFFEGEVAVGNRNLDLAEDVGFELCVDRTDDDIEADTETPCEIFTVDNNDIYGALNGDLFCASQEDGKTFCDDVSCVGGTFPLTFYSCTGGIIPGVNLMGCGYTPGEERELPDGTQLDILCCKTESVESTEFGEAGRGCVALRLSEGVENLEDIRVTCYGFCGTAPGWEDNERESCDRGVDDAIEETPQYIEEGIQQCIVENPDDSTSCCDDLFPDSDACPVIYNNVVNGPFGHVTEWVELNGDNFASCVVDCEDTYSGDDLAICIDSCNFVIYGGRTEVPVVYPDQGVVDLPTDECKAYGQEEDVAIQFCLGCCGGNVPQDENNEPIAFCCELDNRLPSTAGFYGCRVRPQESIPESQHLIKDHGDIVIQYVPTAVEERFRFKVWLDVIIDQDDVARGHERVASRLPGTDTYTFIGLDGRSHPITASSGLSCAAVAGSVGTTPGDGFLPGNPAPRIDLPGDNFAFVCRPNAVKSITITNLDENRIDEDDVRVFCSPIIPIIQE